MWESSREFCYYRFHWSMIDSKECKKIFEDQLSPKLHRMGFEGVFPNYRRIVDEKVHLVDVILSGSIKVFVQIATFDLEDIPGGMEKMFDISCAGKPGRTRLQASPDLQEFPLHPDLFSFRTKKDLNLVIDDMVRALQEHENKW